MILVNNGFGARGGESPSIEQKVGEIIALYFLQTF